VHSFYRADPVMGSAISGIDQALWDIRGKLLGMPVYMWIETNAKIRQAVPAMETLREGLGPDIDIGVDFHAKTSPSVASILVKEVEALNLLFIEEPCPPENVKAMRRIASRSTTPIATGERLIASYSCRELVEMGQRTLPATRQAGPRV
jgi:galactonate dehydratase